jgi:adenine-specific DNA-methyltransferase
MIEQLELALLAPTRPTDRAHKAALGQFMTPAPIATFMASLFESAEGERCKLLDAGAGHGALSLAFIERWRALAPSTPIELHAFEIDPSAYTTLGANLSGVVGDDLTLRLSNTDFIAQQTSTRPAPVAGFTHAILNPPYKKITSSSAHRKMLRQVGIETVNLYSAFIALALDALAPGGQLVAIIPRSFCNGPYYRPFRQHLTERAALRHIHLFTSRTSAFKADSVLQETVIVHLQRDAAQGSVTISTSTDASMKDLDSRDYPFAQIVQPGDPEGFIHIPTAAAPESSASASLSELGIKVSTGPVVDFRLRPQLRDRHTPGCAPLIYPTHMQGQRIVWPRELAKKADAIAVDDDSRRWLYPRGHYCVVRRLSSKEEPRRIVASVVTPAISDEPLIGFENHVNVFHQDRAGLPRALAYGLTAYLNTTHADEAFRQFNGHTQVNVADLKALRYPTTAQLVALGEWAMCQESLDTPMCDAQWEALR